jgi:protoporphyrinogen oxidase
MVNRLTRIYYKNKFNTYPIKNSSALINLGALEAGLCVFSYLIERFFATKQDGSFETWVQKRFGRDFQSVFFKVIQRSYGE